MYIDDEELKMPFGSAFHVEAAFVCLMRYCMQGMHQQLIPERTE